MGFIKGIFYAAIFTLLVKKIINGVWLLKPGLPIHNHAPGPCWTVAGPEGSEDFALLSDGQVLVSSGLRFHTDKFPDREGRIMLFDFKKPKSAEEVKIIWKKEADKSDKGLFNPHGIDILTKGGKTYVFVVNHPENEDCVERFVYDGTKRTLTHLETIQTPDMHSVNSLAATDERSFFFSNMNYFREGIMVDVETFLDFKWGSIGSYDGKTSTSRILKNGYNLPNGLALSRDRKKLYLSNIGSLAVETFEVLSINNVSLVHTLDVMTGVDNVQMDPSDGSLWLGSQPSLWLSVLYLKNPDTLLVPSQVLRAPVGGDGVPTGELSELYRNNGDQITLSTVALHYQRKLIIGSLYDTMLCCDINV